MLDHFGILRGPCQRKDCKTKCLDFQPDAVHGTEGCACCGHIPDEHTVSPIYQSGSSNPFRDDDYEYAQQQGNGAHDWWDKDEDEFEDKDEVKDERHHDQHYGDDSDSELNLYEREYFGMSASDLADVTGELFNPGQRSRRFLDNFFELCNLHELNKSIFNTIEEETMPFLDPDMHYFYHNEELLNFGVEIELIAKGSGRKGERISPNDIESELSQIGICSRGRRRTHEVTSYWKLVPDASIKAHRDDLPVELVSPVLPTGPESFQEITRVLAHMRDRFSVKVNPSCAFHVHVAMDNGKRWSLQDLKSICHTFLEYEGTLDSLNVRSRAGNDNRFIRSNITAIQSQNGHPPFLINNCDTILELQDLLCPKDVLNTEGRNYKLNLRALDRFGTIEFRQHGGVVDTDRALFWVKLLLEMVIHALWQGSTRENWRPRGGDRDDVSMMLEEIGASNDVCDYYLYRWDALRKAESHTGDMDFWTPGKLELW
ncbi:putative amidoligase enzyme-domain-containing protein [Jimgerdemannia flammicorona]|uniref:Putative amidoligase enzyme-domain-containing protein n=1 Tax=Jimgerdemannia flammicorona TaxID=994334 RepID=A0A433QMS4_9FUNG|nr:putative amidoligase enzyme-domain-containing protein [Jimgerdemannia flammicorona]